MTKEQFAEMLNGSEYRNEISRDQAKIAKDHNLLVCFGASDDLLEMRGIINDELGAWDGWKIMSRVHLGNRLCL